MSEKTLTNFLLAGVSAETLEFEPLLGDETDEESEEEPKIEDDSTE